MAAKPANSETGLNEILKRIVALRRSLAGIGPEIKAPAVQAGDGNEFVKLSGQLMDELQRVREQISPVRFGSIGITLGRSDSIAKFFAFSFVNQEKRNLAELIATPFYGSGVYAVYYHGATEEAYRPLTDTETPIYVGKAEPKDPYAETVEAQGQALYARLKEHAGNIAKTKLKLDDFHFRAAAIQSGMQSAVEDFMIRLFRPIWNKEVKICYGLGKHGDSATTRANKRSPWDTMHPGRKWAAGTTADQMKRGDIVAKIAVHFQRHPIIRDKESLFKLLSLK
jgi:hypothetical protein